LIVHKLEIIF
jgi:uncharacterized membrane protein YgcG